MTESQPPPAHHRGAFLLTALILAGLVLGAIAGELVFQSCAGLPAGRPTCEGWIQAFEFVGNAFFMNLLKMVLVPLVASSVIVGVASVGDPTRLGYVGVMTILYYFATMFIAVVLGVMLVTTIQPGQGIDEAFRDRQVADFEQGEGTEQRRVRGAQGTGLFGAFRNIVSQILPTNPLGAAANGEMLPVISFSLMLGIALTVVGPRGKPLLDVFAALFAAIMKLVEWILWLAPLGVAALMAWTVARIGIQSLKGPLFYFVLTVLSGLAIHGFVVLPLVLFLFGRTNPFRYLYQMRAALLTAFGTDSSSATLPVTIECAEELGGCSRRAAQFVLPIGATVNMDGTALYEAVAVVFLFQCFGIPLGAQELAIIAITATLAAIGAAGIPSAGLVTMVIVVEAVNKSLAALGDGADGPKLLPIAAVGIVLGIDRLLDMCRTLVNVWGDAVGARIITRIAPDEPRL